MGGVELSHRFDDPIGDLFSHAIGPGKAQQPPIALIISCPFRGTLRATSSRLSIRSERVELLLVSTKSCGAELPGEKFDQIIF